MCYDLGKLESKLRKQGKRKGHTPKEVDSTIEDYKRIWRGGPVLLNGFAHPMLPLVFQDGAAYTSQLMRWGLVPPFIKDNDKANKLMNMTINCQSETAFEKPSFKHAIRQHRAILPINGWFEHQHVGGKPYPYFIHDAEGEYFYMGCIYSTWDNPALGKEETTFSIVTTKGNELLTRIHNKPANGQGPRMPLLLSGDAMLEWLHPSTPEDTVKEIMVSYPDDLMDAYTVKPIRGKNVDTESEDVLAPHSYQELDSEQLSLF
jgi:putative SOS response-associated peptidase YedK